MTSDSPSSTVKFDPVEDDLPVKGLVQVLDPDLRLGGRSSSGAQKRSFVRKKSAKRIARLPATTARVVERPTPSAPPSV